MIFRDLYKELPLEDYLPPGMTLEMNKRRALLQRMTVMAGKLLADEVLRDLVLLTETGDDRPYSTAEKLLFESLVDPSYYELGSLFAQEPFLRHFLNLVSLSKEPGRIKKGLYGGLLRALIRRPGPRRAWGVLRVWRLLGSQPSFVVS